MVNFFLNLNYLYQALVAGLFTWFITLLGASLVYFFHNSKSSVLDLMLGLSGGVMISASFFSLLLPSLDLSHEIHKNSWLLPCLGFMIGGLIIFIFEKILNKKLKSSKNNFLLIFS